MNNLTFRYFSYGSNMLTSRLRARCPSARPAGVYAAYGWGVEFSKRSGDGSGKATLIPTKGERALGVLFDIAKPELAKLDEAEGRGYDRIDNFIVQTEHGKNVSSVTYIANSPVQGLRPYDWYIALVIAGANEHLLEEQYRSALKAIPYQVDERSNCNYREAALEALRAAGFETADRVLQVQG